jgi:ATP-dependent helicase HrpA
LVAAIRDNPVVIVAGETGSGKSTQLPKMCLEAGQGRDGMIGHTQPRRLAARTVAERIADELHTEIGGEVGYTVRFNDRVGDQTLIRVMTDGILLAEIARDRSLRRYDTVIVDEAHERSLNIDFILGYLRQLRRRRPDLKVIVTSATIDTARFSEHFDGAPVVEVAGRGYPVELRYRPPGDGPDDGQDPIQAIVDAIDELRREGPGDVLVFLSGEREIRDTADALTRLARPDTEVLPLYARLSSADQHRVYQSHAGRRIVLATNVAETSITVPGIRYVVDPGTARISRYNRRTKVQRLPIEAVSQASANQRAGRCGRVAPGICIRLYGEDDFVARPEFTEPEVLRTNLAAVILQMTAIGLGDIAAFPFIEPPDAKSIGDGIALLEELGALELGPRQGAPRLTPVGRRLARLPLDPRFGRMVLEADRQGSVTEVTVIAAALSIRDPRERPLGKEQEAAAAHARFADPTSDFLSYLELWDYLQHEQSARSSNQFRKLCRTEFLNYQRVREWQDVHGQLLQASRALGIAPNDEPATPDRIHRALLAGLLSHIGMRDDPRPDLLGARAARFTIAPGSALARKPPAWVMVAELVETNRLRGRVAARIDPAWAENLGAHLAKRSHGEPWWDADRGTAMTEERVSLYGLPIVRARTVNLGRVDPRAARAMFIRHALVEGDWETHHGFAAQNAALVDDVLALEDRLRRRDLLATEDARADFFDRRIGEDVVSARHFDAWWKKEREERPDLMAYTMDDVLDPDAGPIDASGHPDEWRAGDLVLPLRYEFDPSSEFDGVTLDIPLPLVERTELDRLDWNVPGIRTALVVAAIRSLPKAWRRHFSPAVETAEAIVAAQADPTASLAATLTTELRARTGEPVTAGDWSLDRVPDELRITFRVVDGHGEAIAWSKDLDALRDHVRPTLRRAVMRAARPVERDGLTAWTIGVLPRTVAVDVAGHRVAAFPALDDEGESVAVRAFVTPAEQRAAMWDGTRRLLLLTAGSPLPAVRRLLRNDTALALAHGDTGAAAVLEDCVRAALDEIVAAAGGPAWDADGFAALVAATRDGLVDGTLDLAVLAGQILTTAHQIVDRIDGTTAAVLQPSLTDTYVQVGRLTAPGFVATTGAARLRHVPRYLAAATHRLDKLARDPARDRALMARVQDLEQALDRDGAADPAGAQAVRWMIEELRVSFFAQALGTAEPVSERRVLEAIGRLAR